MEESQEMLFRALTTRQLTLQNATMRCQYRKTLNTHRDVYKRQVYFRAGCARSSDGGQGRESDHGNADSFGNHLTNAFSAICCLQKSRFTASKPSIFAIASDEKFIRQPTTSFVRCCLKDKTAQTQTKYSKFSSKNLQKALDISWVCVYNIQR